MVYKIPIKRARKMKFAQMYHDVLHLRKIPDNYAEFWNFWLWECNCIEPMLECCGDMNQMHLAGLLISFIEDLKWEGGTALPSLLPHVPLVHLYTKPIAAYTLRELTTQVECLQLSWGCVLGHSELPSVLETLKRLMARFGHIVQHAYQESDMILDDSQYLTSIPGGINEDSQESKPLFITTRKYIRQMVCIFLALFRALFIIERAEVAPEVSGDSHKTIQAMLKQHHVESSMDCFNEIQQIISLAPGMRLVYRTNFAGMYNDISQVVYFHNPKFTRQPQMSMKEIVKSSIHTLPLMTELFPHIKIFLDDDPEIPWLTEKGALFREDHSTNKQAVPSSIREFVRPSVTAAAAKGPVQQKYAWLICCSSVFLLDLVEHKIWASPDQSLIPLAALFIPHIGLQEQQTSDFRPKTEIISTAHGHVELMSDD